MSAQRFHLAWFMNFRADEWNATWGSGGQDWSGSFYAEMARAVERACFDYMIIEDTVMVPDAYGESAQMALRHAVAPKHDPAPLAVVMGRATSRLGIVPTLSTSFYPPFLLARLCATIDHIVGGRLGWNIVTSAEDRAAQNFGMDRLYEHDERYNMADEYVDLVCKLWDSWDADAVVRDRETGVYADYTKVHTIDFAGKYYKSRGPLNTVRPPQGPGASPRGREFAAKTADSVIATATGVEAMTAYRDDIRAKMEAVGRDPDDCKVLYLVAPVLGETEDEARAMAERMRRSQEQIDRTLALISSITEVDFSRFDLDAPPPDDITTNGERGSLEKFLQRGSGKTLRELAADGMSRSVELIGTPDRVAEQMGEIMGRVGGDGFLITSPSMRLNRRYITEVTDGLVPALQRRGLVRSAYAHKHFRDNLLEF